MARYEKKFHVENWSRTFTNAYACPYKTRIGIAKPKSTDLYTAHKVTPSEKLASIIGRTINVYDEISYENLVKFAQGEDVRHIYLDIDIDEYTIEFVVYLKESDDIVCIYEDQKELLLAMKLLTEIDY